MNKYEKYSNANLVKCINNILVLPNLFNYRILSSKDNALCNEILNRTNTLPSDAKLNERIYCLLNNIKIRPICPVCNKNTLKFNGKCYNKTCSNVCHCKNPENIEMMRNTLINFSADKKQNIRKKKEETTFKNFGVKSCLQAGEVRENVIVQGVRNKYGCDNVFQAEPVKETIMETKQLRHNDPFYNNREKFKVTIGMRTDEQKQKSNELRKQTCLEQYNVTATWFISKVKEFQN